MSAKFDANKERAFLDQVSQTYTNSTSPQAKTMKRLIMRTFDPFMTFPDALGLEMGCSDAYMTQLLADRVPSLDVVDGSKKFIDEAVAGNSKSNVNFYYSLFEEFSAPENLRKYDYVFACYILEHVVDVGLVLEVVKSLLKPGGLLFVVVPNGRAISRQLALEMGLLSDLYALTENDHRFGHRRVFDLHSLLTALRKQDLSVISSGGIMFKFLADFQMDALMNQKILNQSHIDGLYRLGLMYPDLAGGIYAVCRGRQQPT